MGEDGERDFDWAGLPVIATVARLLFYTGRISDGPPPSDSSRGGSRSRGVLSGRLHERWTSRAVNKNEGPVLSAVLVDQADSLYDHSRRLPLGHERSTLRPRWRRARRRLPGPIVWQRLPQLVRPQIRSLACVPVVQVRKDQTCVNSP